MVNATDLCICGHPRHLHVHLNEFYPAICSHVDPRAADTDPEPYDGVCMCLKFDPDTTEAAAS